MKTIVLLLFGCLVSATAARADSKFLIDLITPAKRYLYVDKAWQETADCVEAKVAFSETMPSNDVKAKAYFFGADGKLLHTEKEPSEQGDHNGGTLKTPPKYEHGKKYAFCFGIPSAINSGAGKWKRVIVVVGKGSDFAYKIYPKDDLAKFEFPEKPKVASSLGR
jgi:hypothetical protein